ncbi:MAG: nitroreductase family protein [Burkholderiales bacterium]|nr:nitroreductase family protein [Burkholderiales bacterium]
MTAPPDAEDDVAAFTQALIGSRYSVAPKHLHAPGPDAAQLQRLVEAAATAPDHHDLRPWRLLRIADHQRLRLADLFEACSRDRVPTPEPRHIERSRAKALHAPLLLLAVLRSSPEDEAVPYTERAVTLGAALMALLLAAHGMGYGAMLSGGRALRSPRFAQAFGLGADEQAVCFVSVGTAAQVQRRPRPSAHELLADWAPPDIG